MGNFMIGNFYPPYLGRIEKIFCGQEQCWPAGGKDGVLRIIVKDNPVDQNVLMIKEYVGYSLWLFVYGEMFYYYSDRNYGLMYVEPYQTPVTGQPSTSGFYQVVESDAGMRTFWVTDRTFYPDPGNGWTVDNYSDIIIYKDWPNPQPFHINVYQFREGYGDYEKVLEYNLQSDIIRMNNVEYNTNEVLSFKNDEKGVIISMKPYNTMLLERIETDHDDKIMPNVADGTCTIPYINFSNDIYTINLYYDTPAVGWTINVYDKYRNYQLVRTWVIDPKDIWKTAVTDKQAIEGWYYYGKLVCHADYLVKKEAGVVTKVICTLAVYDDDLWQREGIYKPDGKIEVLKMPDGTFAFNTGHRSKCYVNDV